MHFSSVLLPLPLRPTMPKNSPCAISTLTSWTAFSSSYSVLRNGCSTRSLSVEYCWWGSRNVLLTPLTDTAVARVGESSSASTVAVADTREGYWPPPRQLACETDERRLRAACARGKVRAARFARARDRGPA